MDFFNAVWNGPEGRALFKWIMSGRSYPWTNDCIILEMQREKKLGGWHFMGCARYIPPPRTEPFMSNFVPEVVRTAFEYFKEVPSEDINKVRKVYSGLVMKWHPYKSVKKDPADIEKGLHITQKATVKWNIITDWAAGKLSK